ncbi:hypothetical protein [Rufibacter psychrotolerans]|uniref:hypothetical protein n=1 Tax=Rufibacter psychrotolerans TaxID=2812556 RepID=UPI001967717F|nr:hypothetical protein [Rufibacter sp. SYSU D00308]
MKKEMLMMAAALMLTGAACSTYTSSTDPDDLGTGYALSDNQEGTGNNSSMGVAEANNNATFDNQATGAATDSTRARPQADSTAQQRAGESAPIRVGVDNQ